ncbi:MAG: hypothetical protein AB7O56_10165 [Bauldia sp.]
MEIIPPKPPAPGQLAKVGASAGRGLLKSFDVAKRIGSAVTSASGKAATRAAKLLAGTAGSVSRGTAQLVAWRPGQSSRGAIDVDALRRENARTLTDVAELLLRETREENEGLKERLSRLEAAIGTDAGEATLKAIPVETPPGKPTPAAGGRRGKASTNRTSAKRGTPAKRRSRRSPAQQESLVPETAPIALAPDLGPDLRASGDAKVVRMESRRNGARRRRVSSPVEAAG